MNEMTSHGLTVSEAADKIVDMLSRLERVYATNPERAAEGCSPFGALHNFCDANMLVYEHFEQNSDENGHECPECWSDGDGVDTLFGIPESFVDFCNEVDNTVNDLLVEWRTNADISPEEAASAEVAEKDGGNLVPAGSGFPCVNEWRVKA